MAAPGAMVDFCRLSLQGTTEIRRPHLYRYGWYGTGTGTGNAPTLTPELREQGVKSGLDPGPDPARWHGAMAGIRKLKRTS